MSHTVAANRLRRGDVVHITTHTCHGRQVACGDHHIAITAIHADYDVIVIDYTPMSTWDGCTFHSGTVAYERTSRIDLLWHDDDMLAMARGLDATFGGMVA